MDITGHLEKIIYKQCVRGTVFIYIVLVIYIHNALGIQIEKL
jgi:hypothetical protein